MSTIKEKLEYRYKQAEFFNAKVRGTTDPFEAACNFTAFLAIFRSLFQQSENALRLPREAECWNRLLNPWIASSLSVQQQECERLLKRIRDKEIHVEAQAVEAKPFSTTVFDHQQQLRHINVSQMCLAFEDLAGQKHRLQQTCDTGLGIIRKLLDDHFP